jgi:chromosome partitioning protein
MSMQEKIIEFFKERPALSVNQIEKEAGLPPTTLSKAVRGERNLNEAHIQKLIPILKKYGFIVE